MRLKDIPRISSKLDQDGTRIAPGRRNPYRSDHLFEDLPVEGHFGVYIARNSKRGLTLAIRQYERVLPIKRSKSRDQIGDTDGCLYFQTTNPHYVPEWFKKSLKQIHAGKQHGFIGRAQ